MDLAEILKGLASNDLEELARQEEALHWFLGELDTGHGEDFATLEKVVSELGHYLNLRIKLIRESGG